MDIAYRDDYEAGLFEAPVVIESETPMQAPNTPDTEGIAI
jgi:hypothetical protein